MKNEIIANSCRICLTQTKKLRSLYKAIDEGDEPPNEMLHLVTGIQVEKLEEYETLPKNICKNCELSLNMAFEFRENALRTQKLIVAHLKELCVSENNGESNKYTISKFKREYEEIMNLEPLDCVDALEEDMQILSNDEHKSTVENEEELNEADKEDEDYIEQEEHDEYYKQQEENSYLFKDSDEDEEASENKNEAENDTNEEQKENEDLEPEMCDDREEILYKDDQVEIVVAENEDYDCNQKLATKGNSIKTSKNNLTKVDLPIKKLSDIYLMDNMKIIPRRGRKRNVDDQNGYICDICGNVFAKLGRMMEHRVRHNKELRYCCEICDQKFLTRELLRKHMFSHSGGKPLKCKYCSRTFYYESVRRAHEAVHQGHKPYVCNVCDKAFGYAHALKKHKLIHAEIKLYRCEYCNKDFRLQHHMKQHEMTKLHQNAVRFANNGSVIEDCSEFMSDEQNLNDDILLIEEISDDQLASGS